MDFEVVLPSAAAQDLLLLLEGYETLLRWGDLRFEQLTLALHDGHLADDGAELRLAARVHRLVELLHEQLDEPDAAESAFADPLP